MVLGLVLTGLGFLAMVAAVYEHAATGKASMMWLVIAYFFHTTGELCISPVGLSMVTKLAPAQARLADDGRVVPDQLLCQLAGRHHRLVRREPRRTGDLRRLAGTLFVFAVILWMLSGMLVRWMHGAEDVKRA